MALRAGVRGGRGGVRARSAMRVALAVRDAPVNGRW
jgi:hypothetical protein